MQNIIEIPVEFKPLFTNEWREAAIWGGRYSLKSHSVARFLLIRAREKKTRVACFREFQNSIAESSHQLLADLIHQYGLRDFEITNNSIVNKLNGSDFLFRGLHQNEQSIKSIEGIDIAWVEEAQTVSNTSLEVLTPTVRKKGSQIVYTYNRLLEDDPVHKRLVIEGRPNTLKINVNYDIAEKYGFLPQVIKEEIEDDKQSRPSLYKHKWLGEPISNELRIYSGWREAEEIPKGARLERRWLDFGYTNDPTAIGEVWYCDGEWVLDESLYAKGLSNKQIADHLLSLPSNKTLIIADSAEPKSIDELRNYGLNVSPCEKGKDSVIHGIQQVQGQPIAVVKRAKNIWDEYRKYIFLQDKTGRILNEEDPTCANHQMAGIRYALSTLGKLKQVENYWDRIYHEELQQTSSSQENVAL